MEWSAATAENAPPSTSIVKLNVGGHKFTTTVSTLVGEGGYFAALFSGRWRSLLTEVGVELELTAWSPAERVWQCQWVIYVHVQPSYPPADAV